MATEIIGPAPGQQERARGKPRRLDHLCEIMEAA
jgi:hypothetical protein